MQVAGRAGLRPAGPGVPGALGGVAWSGSLCVVVGYSPHAPAALASTCNLMGSDLCLPRGATPRGTVDTAAPGPLLPLVAPATRPSSSPGSDDRESLRRALPCGASWCPTQDLSTPESSAVLGPCSLAAWFSVVEATTCPSVHLATMSGLPLVWGCDRGSLLRVPGSPTPRPSWAAGAGQVQGWPSGLHCPGRPLATGSCVAKEPRMLPPPRSAEDKCPGTDSDPGWGPRVQPRW